MKAILILLLLTSLSLLSSAQKYCGFDRLRDHHIQTEPEFLDLERAFNEQIIERYIATRGGEDDLIIPVVVHVIHDNGPEDIPDSQVIQAIEDLNNGFANAANYETSDGVNIGVQFCLAQRDPDNNFTTGINHVQSELTDVLVPSQDLDLKDVIRWNPYEYLNIWVVKEITREDDNTGVVGYATFPVSHGSDKDGIVCEAATFGASETGSKVHIHEAGHYLGLYHTFQDGCPNGNCLLSGDMVCDTPPDAHVFNTICNDGTNSCLTDEEDLSDNNPFRPTALGGLGDQVDDQTNYMDYSNLVCFNHFTIGQKDRMVASLIELRSSLLDGLQCFPPCSSPITADASASATMIFVNETVTFENNSSEYTSAGWYIDDEFLSSDLILDQTFTATGIFTVELILENGEPGCTETITFIIHVDCPATASFEASDSTVGAGQSVTFDNTSENATGFEWYVNGDLVSDLEDLTFVFDEPGQHSVQLLALADGCSVYSEVWNVSVGQCNVGNEGNIWHCMNSTGNIYGLNFNAQPPSAIGFNPFSQDLGHCKTTICDAAGNFLFASSGTTLFNSSYQPTPNGSGLLGHQSSHYGTMFIQRPGSDTQYYLFTSDAQENGYSDGLRFSVVDKTLDDGNGDITSVKNVLIDVTGIESYTAVRHCNLTDAWLLTYNEFEGVYKSFLISADTIGDPVISAVVNNGTFDGLAMKPSPRGDRVVHGSLVLDFDNSTGELELEYDLDDEFALGCEFSPSGKYLYFLTGQFFTELLQINTEENPEDWLDNAYVYPLDGNPIYFYPQLAPNGTIYLEEVLSNQIGIIHWPNLPGALSEIEEDAFATGALINSFGNYYHGYVLGQEVFINGPDEVCAGSANLFSLGNSECVTDEIGWTIEGASYNEISPGNIEAIFPEAGEYIVNVTVVTDCGDWTGSMNVMVTEDLALELGDDQHICENDVVTLDAGEGWESYEWQDGSSEQELEVTSPGEYWVNVISGACELTDTVTIEGIVSPEIDLGPDFDMCEGDVVVLDIGEGYDDPVWQDGTEGPTYTVYEGGTYTVTVSQPCEASGSVQVDDCDQDILSVGDIDGSPTFTLYPNPVQDQLTVSMEGLAGTVNLAIFDVTGKLVYETQVYGSNLLTIDVSSFADGQYEARFTFGDNNWTEKFQVLSGQ